MRSPELSIEQAHKLNEQVGAGLRYLDRMVECMTQREFSPTDLLRAAAIRARGAVQDLLVSVIARDASVA